jgi:hypothetical protein
MIAASVQGAGMRLRRAMWGAMLWIGATAVGAADPVSPGGGVVDMAGVLDADTMLQLDSTLANYASATGFTFQVVTVSDLADEELEQYARLSLLSQMAARGDFDVRVAVLMWSSAQQFLIAISPGFGNELSSTEVSAVMQNQVLPQVTVGDVGAAMLHGVYGLMVAAGEPSDEADLSEELVVVSRWTEDSAAAAPSDDAAADAAALFEQAEGVSDGWLQSMGDDPAAALSEGYSRAQAQWADVQTRLSAMASGASAAPAAHAPFAIAVVVALAVLAGVWAITRSPAAVVAVLGLGAAVACWTLIGYAELAALLALSGIGFGIGLQLLTTMLRGGHEARLQPSPYSPTQRMPPPRPAAVAQNRPPASRPATPPVQTSASARKTDGPDSQQKWARPEHQSFGEALARAHRDGVRTPMFDYLIANKDSLKATAAARKQQRQYWLIGIVIGFFVFLPLALILMFVWMTRELNHLKPPQISLAEFLRQLIAEVRSVSRYQKPAG